MATVHFYGISKVREAFVNKGIPYYTIVSGKKIIHKNTTVDDLEEAADGLQEFLEMLNPTKSDTYSLNIYESIPAGGINSKTPEDYGFNFKLRELDGTYEEWMEKNEVQKQQRQSNWNEMFSRISAIEQRLSEKEIEDDDDDDDDEQPTGLSGVLGSLLDRPEVQGAIVNFIGQMFAPKSAKIAGTGESDASLDETLETLKKYDPQLENDLKLLAEMAVNNTAQFNFLLTMLRK